jgi:hypothetical protein
MIRLKSERRFGEDAKPKRQFVSPPTGSKDANMFWPPFDSPKGVGGFNIHTTIPYGVFSREGDEMLMRFKQSLGGVSDWPIPRFGAVAGETRMRSERARFLDSYSFHLSSTSSCIVA